MKKIFRGLKIAGIIIAIPGAILVFISLVHMIIRETDTYIPQFMELKMENTLSTIGTISLLFGIILAAIMFIAEDYN